MVSSPCSYIQFVDQPRLIGLRESFFTCIFDTVDKWKNARLKNPDASTEEIAAIAFPDAAMAMLLTTTTTAVAFFGTAVCPVAPILCFAVFVGVMVVFDYVLCCLLVFPALAIYDRADKSRRCCCHVNFTGCCKCCQKKKDDQDSGDALEEAGEQSREDITDEPAAEKSAEMRRSMIDESVKFDESKQNSLIHRILTGYYNFLHRFRWPLLVICGGSLVRIGLILVISDGTIISKFIFSSLSDLVLHCCRSN